MLNFAHGAIEVVGAYAHWEIKVKYDQPAWLAAREPRDLRRDRRGPTCSVMRKLRRPRLSLASLPRSRDPRRPRIGRGAVVTARVIAPITSELPQTLVIHSASRSPSTALSWSASRRR